MCLVNRSFNALSFSWRTALNSVAKWSRLSRSCCLNSWANCILYGWSPRSSRKMRRMVLLDKCKAASCCNADRVGLWCTASLTLLMFAGVWTELPLLVNDDITLPAALNLLNQFKIVFLEGIWPCFSTLNSLRNRCCVSTIDFVSIYAVSVYTHTLTSQLSIVN